MARIPLSEFANGKTMEDIKTDIPYMEQPTNTSGPEELAPGSSGPDVFVGCSM